MPYLLLAVCVRGGFTKIVPLVGDMSKELAQLAETVSQVAL